MVAGVAPADEQHGPFLREQEGQGERLGEPACIGEGAAWVGRRVSLLSNSSVRSCLCKDPVAEFRCHGGCCSVAFSG